MREEYEKINTPEELLNFMSNNINYGYLGKSGRVYHFDDKDFNEKWYEEYVLEDSNDILDNLHGNCWDQVELEREWFIKHNYEIKTIYEMVDLDYENNYPSHSFLIFKNKNIWNWFENSDFNNRGIHTFNSLHELIDYQYNKYLEYLREFNIKEEEIKKIILREFKKPKMGITAKEYLSYVTNSKKINL